MTDDQYDVVMSSHPVPKCLYGRPYVVVNQRETPGAFETIAVRPIITELNLERRAHSQPIAPSIKLHIDGIAVGSNNTTGNNSVNVQRPETTFARVEDFLLDADMKGQGGGDRALSQYELSKKARAMGIFVRHDGSSIPCYDGAKLNDETLEGTSDVAQQPGGETEENTADATPSQHGGVSLPKLPLIKHPYETEMPPVMHQREPANSCELPVCTSTITPRLKPLVSSKQKRQNKEDKTVDNDIAGEVAEVQTLNKIDEANRTFRLIVSPNSRYDLKFRAETYYNRRFPHVVFDGTGPRTGHVEKNNKNTTTTTSYESMLPISLPLITRSKKDLTAIEQEINRKTRMVKPVQTIAGWLNGFYCNPKKLHQRKDLLVKTI